MSVEIFQKHVDYLRRETIHGSEVCLCSPRNNNIFTKDAKNFFGIFNKKPRDLPSGSKIYTIFKKCENQTVGFVLVNENSGFYEISLERPAKHFMGKVIDLLSEKFEMQKRTLQFRIY